MTQNDAKKNLPENLRHRTNNGRNDRYGNAYADQYGRRATDHLTAFVTSSFAAQVIGQFPHEQGDIVNSTAPSYRRTALTPRAQNITPDRIIQDISA